MTVALVIIGRNEGQRLIQCLQSIPDSVLAVYVDSGSTDGSVLNARQYGVHVVELDMTVPFTAARARNHGIAWIRENLRETEYIQFIDGDCQLAPGWIEAAQKAMEATPSLGAVFGRRREKFPEQSIYNRLCDNEWAVAPGEAKYFAGDVMIRRRALDDVGGYRNDMIAGEEPELSLRLRQSNWQIQCLAHEMTLHDAAITSFFQWWQRTKRSGYAYALGAHLHGGPPEYHWRTERRRVWLWGIILPAFIVMTAVFAPSVALLLALIYPTQMLRLSIRDRKQMTMLSSSVLLVVGRFAEAQGLLKFHLDQLSGKSAVLIEYK